MSIDEPSRQLLMAIAECPIRSGPSRLVQMAEAIREWNPVIDIAVKHGVTPTLFSILAKAGAPIPPLVERYLRDEYERNRIRILANAFELIELLQVLEREGIPAVPFKGVVLGASAWADPTIRPAGDLDLLIRFEHLHRATTILLERGYVLTEPLSRDASATFDDCYEYHFEATVGWHGGRAALRAWINRVKVPPQSWYGLDLGSPVQCHARRGSSARLESRIRLARAVHAWEQA